MHIRRYKDRDKEFVRSLHKVAMEKVDSFIPGPWDTDMNAIFEVYLNGRGDFLVVEVDNKIIAMGALRPIDDTRAEIKRMRVHSDFQRQSFGQRILAELELKAKSLGYKFLELDTLENQTGAIRFFRKNGYKLTRTRSFKGREQYLFRKEICKSS